MHLKLVRDVFGPDATSGLLYVDGKRFCYTLEDTVRQPGSHKIAGHTAIPYGQYDVVLTMSPRFKQIMPLIKNVPGFEGIRIHAGNQHTDTEGCVLVGYARDTTQRNAILKQSRVCYLDLLEKMKQVHRGESITMEITNVPD
jgi:hypothetical protein